MAGRRTLIFLICSGILLPGALRAQPAGHDVTGTVTDSVSGQPLEGVNIVVPGTVMGTATGPDGIYRISGLPAGPHALRFSMIGYALATDTVRIRSDSTVRLDEQMHPTALQSPQLVVTGEKRSVQVTESPVSIGTIGTSDLRLRMPTTINEILPYQPGVQMVGGQINIRGSSGYTRGAGSRVLVLIDGVPVLASDSDGMYWDVVPTTEIQRVEILKGPGSALYGSNALGGVVNIITRPISSHAQTILQGQGGLYTFPSYPSWRWREAPLLTGQWHASHEQRLGKIGYRVGLGQQSSAGYYQNGWFRRWSLDGKISYDPSDNTHWDGRIFLVDDTHGVFTQWRDAHQPFNAPPETLGDYLTNHQVQTALNYSHQASPRLAHTWRTTYYRKAFQNYQHDNDDYSTSHILTTEWQTDYQASGRHFLTLGLQASLESILANVWRDHSGITLAGYFQDEWRLTPLLRMVFGLREDISRIDRFAVRSQLNPKLGLNYHLTDLWSLRASVGRGFRAPSIAERFTQTTQHIFQIVPNPDLHPELSLSWEVGTHYQGPRLRTDLALFSSRFTDFIDPVRDPRTGTISFQNITDARITGIDFSTEFQVPGLPVQQTIGYTYIDPRDLSQDTVLAYRHRHSVVTATKVLLNRRAVLSLEYQFRSQMERVQVFPTNPVTGADRLVPVHLLSLHGFYRFSPNLTVRLAVTNLLQYYYVMFERNMGPPRQIQAGFEYSW